MFLIFLGIMAEGSNYGISKESEKEEYFDDAETLSSKLDKLADWVRSSDHMIIFTGAGVSTSTGIPDFRSGNFTYQVFYKNAFTIMYYRSVDELTMRIIRLKWNKIPMHDMDKLS